MYVAFLLEKHVNLFRNNLNVDCFVFQIYFCERSFQRILPLIKVLVLHFITRPGFPDQVDHTLITYGTIQFIQFFLCSYHDQYGIIYDSEYGQPGTINFYGPV